MKIIRDSVSVNTIRRVGRGSILLGDTTYANNIGITADVVLDRWPSCAFDELNLDRLAPILEHAPELLILGSGSRPQRPPRELVFALARRGIGLEVMDTPAACRTFNILVAEGRAPAAVMYIDDQTL